MHKPDYLYIHIPFCFSKCKYCDFFSIPGSKIIPDEYISALCNEIILRNQKSEKVWKSVYIGGGTPSLLSENQLSKIFQAVKACGKIDSLTEVTIEVNPDDVTQDFLLMLERNSINRISCGIQTLNEKSLEFSGRRASLKQNIAAMELIQKFWNHRYSFDLICGLPYETEKSFLEGIKKILTFNPDHISMYSLTFEDETPFGKLLNNGSLDYDFDFSDDLWLKGRELLLENGFNHYEVSNFAKKGFESIHNLSYWNHESYCGCGSGAAGTVYNENGSGIRWINTIQINKYCSLQPDSAIHDICDTESVDIETSKFEFFMMGLRKLKGVNEAEYKSIFNEKFPENVKKLARNWNEKKLCIIKNEDDFSFTLGKEGILFLNRFLEELEI